MNPLEIVIKIAKDTKHYEEQRQYREQFIQDVIGQGKEIYRGYTKNKDKPWLDEVHRVFDNGVIQVVNPVKDKELPLEKKPTVTKKIARPGQLRAVFNLPYYDGIANGKIKTHQMNRPVPDYVMKKAIYHQRQGWNRDEKLPPKNLWKAVKGLRDRDLGVSLVRNNNNNHGNNTGDYKYIYDPKHRKRPGGGYQKTDKGWSKA